MRSKHAKLSAYPSTHRIPCSDFPAPYVPIKISIYIYIYIYQPRHPVSSKHVHLSSCPSKSQSSTKILDEVISYSSCHASSPFSFTIILSFILSFIISVFSLHHLITPSHSLYISAISIFHQNKIIKISLPHIVWKELSCEPSMKSCPINQPSRKLSFKTQKRTSFLKKGFTFEVSARGTGRVKQPMCVFNDQKIWWARIQAAQEKHRNLRSDNICN